MTIIFILDYYFSFMTQFYSEKIFKDLVISTLISNIGSQMEIGKFGNPIEIQTFSSDKLA